MRQSKTLQRGIRVNSGVGLKSAVGVFNQLSPGESAVTRISCRNSKPVAATTKTTECISNVNLMEQNVIQINGGTMINVDVSVRNIIYVKKNMFGILVHVTVKMENI